MKNTIQGISLKLFVLFACLCSGYNSIAQDGTTSQTSSTHTSTSTATTPDTMWYSNPIVWVIAGVVLLVIIIAAVASNSKKVSNSEVSRTTTTTTTIKED